ncbi:MAG: methionyl-tRNA formyltransferase [Candidatus Sungbacteria bacterium]|uniref:Methionyl-tRNA formyltransferase n=1 Tax=Candidatus Sungiibacteriota bacterium TaxID=2750080 RepID=A0A932VRU6_9BACT|nr:methionyl-tRNA formyltransferase [Candidatus Sungbacteria bacterium]
MIQATPDPIQTPILFFGTSEFAVPALEALLDLRYPVVGVVTNPDEAAGRRRTLTACRVKIAALKHHLPVFQPERLDPKRFSDQMPRADLYLVAAYGKIIPKQILAAAPRKALNIHPSLLPRWRGASPIQYAILKGDTKTGVTIMRMDELLDHGPIVAQVDSDIDLRKTTYRDLHYELANLGAMLLKETLPRWIRGEITPTPQDDAQATYCKQLARDDGRIDWSGPAEEIERMIRAFDPWPGAWTLWPRSAKIVRVRIVSSQTTSYESSVGGPGYVWQNAQHPMLVKTGRGSLVIAQLGAEGKKITDAASFVRGYRNIISSVFI